MEEDGLSSGPRPMNPSAKSGVPHAIERGLGVKGDERVITYEQWKKVDAEEEKRGVELGKERERMTWKEVDAFLS